MSQREREREREKRERERELFGRFSAGRLASFGAFGPRSSDLVDRGEQTTSRSPAAMSEWRSGALGEALCAEKVVV